MGSAYPIHDLAYERFEAAQCDHVQLLGLGNLGSRHSLGDIHRVAAWTYGVLIAISRPCVRACGRHMPSSVLVIVTLWWPNPIHCGHHLHRHWLRLGRDLRDIDSPSIGNLHPDHRCSRFGS